jgi:hypothetical protein
MKLSVEKPEDWHAIAKIGGPVVDPMILRCGEIFIGGANGAPNQMVKWDQAAAWDLLTQNIHALSTFFDRIILHEQIPVFNYADTFDMTQNLNRSVFDRVNEKGDILVDVNVRHDVYWQVKTAATGELKKLYTSGTKGVTDAEAQNILGELTTSGYGWYPQIDGLELPNDAEKRLASFILGGLIFGGYAELAGSDHLMQPKRSRLFLALSLKQKSAPNLEDHLFGKLAEVSGLKTADIPFTPTFFPMLLQTSANPAEVLANALKLRKSPAVKDYRAWLGEAMTDFNKNGCIPIARTKEVEKIASAIRHKTDGSSFPKVEIKTTIADIAKGPEVSLDLSEQAQSAWGWMIGQLPGKRHRKLLTRAVIANMEYVALDQRVKTVWSASQAGTHGRI